MRRLTGVAGAVALSFFMLSAAVRAQALDAQVVDTPPLGSGVVVTVRLVDPATGAIVSGARIEGARLFGATGSALAATPLAEIAFGIYALRIDLPTPGAWTLQATVAAPGRPQVVVSTSLIARLEAPTPTRADPASPSGGPAVAQEPLPAVASPQVPLTPD